MREGFLHMMFSFRGITQRADFLLALIFYQPIFLFFASWAFLIIYGQSMHMLFGDDLFLENAMIDIDTYPDIMTTGVPLIFMAFLQTWMTWAIYIKRYRHIGVHWIFTVILMIIPYFFIIGMVSTVLAGANFLESVETLYDNLTVTSMAFLAIVLVFYLIIPLFWPGKKIGNR